MKSPRPNFTPPETENQIYNTNFLDYDNILTLQFTALWVYGAKLLSVLGDITSTLRDKNSPIMGLQHLFKGDSKTSKNH